MTNDEQKPSEQKAKKVPSIDVTVPDATHPRFRKLMCRCTEEGHHALALYELHDHFCKFKHKSLGPCSYCGRNEVYEYYFIENRHEKKIYHTCSPQNTNNTSVPPDSPRSNNESVAQPISQSPEISDTESSGIGTGYSSMVSIPNGKSDDNQSTDTSPRKSSNSLSEQNSVGDQSPSSSNKRKSK